MTNSTPDFLDLSYGARAGAPIARRGCAAALAAGALLYLQVSVTAAGAIPDTAPAPAAARILTSTRSYEIPAIQLVRDDGKAVSLREEMNDDRPVVLNFIFTTCISVCPLLSQTMAQFDAKLGPDRKGVHLMSISIDPEEDTPARLREYARKFHAGPEWQHYTGTVEASLAAQRAFGVFRGDKMSHVPVTFLRIAPGGPWTRMDGLVTPDQLLAEYRSLRGQHGDAVAVR
jgi:protein SCO1